MKHAVAFRKVQGRGWNISRGGDWVAMVGDVQVGQFDGHRVHSDVFGSWWFGPVDDWKRRVREVAAAEDWL